MADGDSGKATLLAEAQASMAEGIFCKASHLAQQDCSQPPGMTIAALTVRLRLRTDANVQAHGRTRVDVIAYISLR
jgi:hypothetical protein